MKKFLTILSAIFCCALSFAQTKETLAVAKVTISPALINSSKASNALGVLERIAESLDAKITSSVEKTKKFDVLSRADLDAAMKEISFSKSGNAQLSDMAGKMKAAKYLLIVSIDDFQDFVQKADFASLERSLEVRTLRFGAVVKIMDTATSSVISSSNISLTESSQYEQENGISANGTLTDEAIAKVATKFADTIAAEATYDLFPSRVIAITGNSVSINRGESTGIKIGQIFDVYALGESMVDPDTGENLGNEEVHIGTMQIIRVTPKFSVGNLTDNRGVDKGNIVRPAANK